MEQEPNTHIGIRQNTADVAALNYSPCDKRRIPESLHSQKNKNLHQAHRTRRINHTQLKPNASHNYICIFTPSLHILTGYFLDTFGVCRLDPTDHELRLTDIHPETFCLHFFFPVSLLYFQIREHNRLHTVTNKGILCTTHECNKAYITTMNSGLRTAP